MKKKVVQILLLVIGTSCIAIGIILGQYKEVITKAVNICLECIGIG